MFNIREILTPIDASKQQDSVIQLVPRITFESGTTWADDIVVVKVWAGVKHGVSKAFRAGGVDVLISDEYESIINEQVYEGDTWPHKLTGIVPINSVVMYGMKILRRNDGQFLTVQGTGLALADSDKEIQTISGIHPVGHKLALDVTGLYPVTTDDAKLICNLRDEVDKQGLEHVQAMLTGIIELTEQIPDRDGSGCSDDRIRPLK
ncbi:MAG: hypothetical protein JEY79_10585 [Pseudodesulfovibrio sp.]|nr:hypothetical protein [Pseudodesulfovibrio sp.]